MCPEASGPSEPLQALFEDLEQQAAGLHLADRDAEIADRARGEYAAVTFADRVHASVGRRVRLRLSGTTVVEGRLDAAGTDWCAVVGGEGGGRSEWVVRLAAVERAVGMSARAVPEPVRPVVARLGFGSAIRRVVDEAADVVLHCTDGSQERVRVLRVGADFLETTATGAGREALAEVPGTGALLAFAGVAALRRG